MSVPIADTQAVTSGQKRKNVEPADAQPASKRAAKRRKKGGNKNIGSGGEETGDVDQVLHVNASIARMDGPMVADFLARQTKRFDKDLSIVELEDKRIPATAVADTTAWDGARSLEHLPAFLERVCGQSREQMQTSSRATGSPHTIVVTSAGLRAAELTRSLRVYETGESTVMKMFAKHIKLKDAVDAANKTRVNIGVGTPQRLLDLISSGALRLESLRWIVIDGSHVDQKQRGILDSRDSVRPLVELLSMPAIARRYAQDEVKVVVF